MRLMCDTYGLDDRGEFLELIGNRIDASIEGIELGDVLPATRSAWRDGEISTGAIRLIGSARVKGYDEELGAIEPEPLDAARRGDTWSLGRWHHTSNGVPAATVACHPNETACARRSSVIDSPWTVTSAG